MQNEPGRTPHCPSCTCDKDRSFEMAKPEHKSNKMLENIQIPICNCCNIILKDSYHVMGGFNYCDRCYVSSHHTRRPEICPHITAIKKVMALFQSSWLEANEAEEIKKFIDSRVRGHLDGHNA